MNRYEYMKISLSIIPEEIITQHNLHELAKDGWVYMEIRKGMPGLKQADKIANDILKLHLTKFGYTPVSRPPSIWKHSSKNITFALVVKTFEVKYVGK